MNVRHRADHASAVLVGGLRSGGGPLEAVVDGRSTSDPSVAAYSRFSRGSPVSNCIQRD